MPRSALVLTLLSLPLCLPAGASPLRGAERLDFRVEANGQPYLLRISRSDLSRLAEAISLGQPLPRASSALAVREDLYPPVVTREVPAEVARRAVSIWRLIEERGWGDAAGVEWDPELGHPGRVVNDRGDILRDAPGPASGLRAGVWSVTGKGSFRGAKSAGVRCLEPLSGPKRCFRVWSVPSPRRGVGTRRP